MIGSFLRVILHAYNVELFTFVLILLYNDIITKKKITYIFEDHL